MALQDSRAAIHAAHSGEASPSLPRAQPSWGVADGTGRERAGPRPGD